MNTQLTRCHAENKKSLKPVDLYITSLDKRLGERMENAMQGMHHRWKGVQISTQPYQDVLSDVPSEHLVYLTADSPNVINSLEKEKVYIIGGIVDKNRHKVSPKNLDKHANVSEFMFQQSREARYSTWPTSNWRLHKNGCQTCIDCQPSSRDYVAMVGNQGLGNGV